MAEQSCAWHRLRFISVYSFGSASVQSFYWGGRFSHTGTASEELAGKPKNPDFENLPSRYPRCWPDRAACFSTSFQSSPSSGGRLSINSKLSPPLACSTAATIPRTISTYDRPASSASNAATIVGRPGMSVIADRTKPSCLALGLPPKLAYRVGPPGRGRVRRRTARR